jgi:hypothetical protein
MECAISLSNRLSQRNKHNSQILTMLIRARALRAQLPIRPSLIRDWQVRVGLKKSD